MTGQIILNKIEDLINDYLKREKKVTISISNEWKKEKSWKIYSNQYYAYTELKSFWNDLKKVIKEDK